MEKFVFTISFALLIFVSKGQSFQSLDTIKAPAGFENIYSRPLYADSLASSFVIFIKQEVKAHKHITHTEHVYILEGDGEMTLGYKKFKVKKGDVVFIPKNTPHSLKTTSALPVKVVSLQSPMFDGRDRVFIE
ncbi:MAG: cupin domain-containing protein [Bacteroidia bacterium]|nr:cupin domain-containing protein [Bacteroidia bacterium]